MLYENLQEQLQECLPEFQRQFVVQNYQKFIEASKENDPVFQQFIQLIDKFQSASEKIENMSKDIDELKNAKIKCKQLLEQQLNKELDPIEDVQAEDQLTEMLDNLSMFAFEKNYEQALESYRLLKEIVQSKKFMKLIKKPEIKKQIDEAFKSLCQQLYNDYISQNAQFDSSQLMQYLMILNQIELLIQGYLQIQRDKFINWIDQQTQFSEKQVQQFVGNLIKINQQFEQIFQQYLKKNQLLFSFISSWNQEIIKIFFDKISTFFFQDIVQFDDIFNKSNILLKTFSQYQSKGISIDFDIQKELAQHIELKINDLFGIFGQKINQYFHFNENKLIKLELLSNLLESDKLMESKEIGNLNKPQEIKIKASATIKSTFESLSQPLSMSSCFFWNIVFKLGDIALNFFNPENYSLLSTLLNDSISKLLILFIKDYQQAIKQHKKEGQPIFEIGNLFGNFNLANTLIQYLSQRQSYLPITSNSEWKKLISEWYDELRLRIQQYFKQSVLTVIPFWICEHGKTYTQRLPTATKPSPLFLMLGYSILELKNQFQPIIPQNPTSYFLSLLWDYIKFLLEYSFYWSFHNQGKNNDVFFLDIKQRNELQLDMNQINLQFQQNSIRIQQITQEGLRQLIFDIQFIFDLYSRYVGQLQQNDQFLKKLVTLYCKEKKCEQPQMNNQNFEQYFANNFQQDMIQAKTYIEQQRKSLVT